VSWSLKYSSSLGWTSQSKSVAYQLAKFVNLLFLSHKFGDSQLFYFPIKSFKSFQIQVNFKWNIKKNLICIYLPLIAINLICIYLPLIAMVLFTCWPILVGRLIMTIAACLLWDLELLQARLLLHNFRLVFHSMSKIPHHHIPYTFFI